MKNLTRLFIPYLALTMMLIACTAAPEPVDTPKVSKPATPAETIVQPTDGVKPLATTLSQSGANPGRLSPAFSMTAGRAAHTATLLPDGRVLIAGGFRPQGTAEVPIASAELYDPRTNTFTPTGDMNEARSGHTATLLDNGQVLIAGGWSSAGRTPTAELYDAQTGRFRHAANMLGPRASMTATLLENGQVLIAGGDSGGNAPQFTAEIYDPDANIFRPSGKLNQGRSAHTATLLNDGTVLLVGGRPRYDDSNVLSSAEIYDPLSGGFTFTGNANMPRYKHAAVLLLDGNVLVLGGSNHRGWAGKYTSAEIYDADQGAFRQIMDMNGERFKLAQAALLLNSGDVLIGGGNRQLELFDAQSQRFIAGASIDDDYYFSTATLLQDGRVLIAGGYDSGIQPTEKAWIYTYS